MMKSRHSGAAAAADESLLFAIPRNARTRRAALLDAALATFAAEGYERTSVSAICERAGLPVGTFYQHFRSKRQILLALMGELVRRLDGLDLHLGGDDPGGAIRGLLEAALVDVEIATRHRAIRLWTSSRVAAALRAMQRMPNAAATSTSTRLRRCSTRCSGVCCFSRLCTAQRHVHERFVPSRGSSITRCSMTPMVRGREVANWTRSPTRSV